jgi:hypothetical protein
MKNRATKLLEAKDLLLYKRMLVVLGDYSTNVPMTGVDRLFDTAVEKGAQILPKDKNALEILKCVFSSDSSAAAVHKMLNIRFSDLPVEVRPMAKQKQRHVVASWSRDDVISDRVKDLVDWAGTGKQGMWTDIDGNKVEIIDMNAKEEETK